MEYIQLVLNILVLLFVLWGSYDNYRIEKQSNTWERRAKEVTTAWFSMMTALKALGIVDLQDDKTNDKILKESSKHIEEAYKDCLELFNKKN